MSNKTYLFHESIERLKNIQIITDVISKMIYKYNPYQIKTKFYHICAFINIRTNEIFYGENSLRQIYNIPISTHAEMDVLRKINKSNSKIKKTDLFNIIVIKVSPATGKLGSSRPCYHCIKKMLTCPFSPKIKNVYYSTSDGSIFKEKLKDMLTSDKTVVSRGWKKLVN